MDFRSVFLNQYPFTYQVLMTFVMISSLVLKCAVCKISGRTCLLSSAGGRQFVAAFTFLPFLVPGGCRSSSCSFVFVLTRVTTPHRDFLPRGRQRRFQLPRQELTLSPECQRLILRTHESMTIMPR